MSVRDAVWRIIKCALNNEICTLPDDTDWDALLEECNRQTVQLLAFGAVDPKCIPDAFAEKWKRNFFSSYYVNIKNAEAHTALSKLLEQNGIRFTIFKGIASAAYYAKPELRLTGDVDFYVAQEDFERCHRILTESGYVFQTGANHHERSFYKDGIHFEMHFAFPGVPNDQSGDLLRDAFSDALDQTKEYRSTVVTSDYHHGLIILLHTVYHLVSKGIGLRHLCDWAVFVQHYTKDDFAALFQNILEKCGLWDFALLLTKTCDKYFDVLDDTWNFTDDDDEIADSLANEFYAKGNFGNKESDNFSEMLLSEGFSIKLGQRSPLSQMLQNVFAITKQHWPLAQKSKVILFVGSFWFSVKYTVKAIFGKRKKFNLFKMSKIAKERKEQYKKYGLH